VGRGEANLATWQDHGSEHVWLDDYGKIMARVTKRGCCWYASLGSQPVSSGRFKNLDDAKRVAEQLVVDDYDRRRR
jgi:hypothetical protein